MKALHSTYFMRFVTCSHKCHASPASHTHTPQQEMLVCVGTCVCFKDRSKGQRARVKGHHSGDKVCLSPGQYETKAEFREDVISTVSSSLSSPRVRIKSLCRRPKGMLESHYCTLQTLHWLPELSSRYDFIDHPTGYTNKQDWKVIKVDLVSMVCWFLNWSPSAQNPSKTS